MCRFLLLNFHGLREGLPVLTEHANALLGNLLSLLSVSELNLAFGDYVAPPPPPRLLASLLDALPSSGTMLKRLTLHLVTFEAPTAQTLKRVISQLRLTELTLYQHRDATTDPTILSDMLRDVPLESEIEILEFCCFDLSTIESEC